MFTENKITLLKNSCYALREELDGFLLVKLYWCLHSPGSFKAEELPEQQALHVLCLQLSNRNPMFC